MPPTQVERNATIPWWRPLCEQLDAPALQKKTRNHWNKTFADEASRMGAYMADLLPYELHFADNNHFENLPDRCAGTLATLVGYSLEPLLQTVAVLQPKRVVLLVNKTYSHLTTDNRKVDERGEQRGRLVTGLLKELAGRTQGAWAIDDAHIQIVQTDDTPEAVFRALCDSLLQDQRNQRHVVVDITGAKKSMDAGAFLFAAYAGVDISYVDFTLYEQEKRRPFGYTCRIRPLENPYALFKLHNWEEVRRAYESYHFRAAGHALDPIIALMARSSKTHEGLFNSEETNRVESLRCLLRIYEGWDDGDFWQAQDDTDDIKRKVSEAKLKLQYDFIPPRAVNVLSAGGWPHAAKDLGMQKAVTELIAQQTDLTTPQPGHNGCRLLMHNDLLLTYAYDELCKVGRLVEHNEDLRSALLRAAGLDELLLRARIVRLFALGCLRGEKTRSGASAPDDATILQGLVEYHGAENMRHFLRHEMVLPPHYNLPINYWDGAQGTVFMAWKPGWARTTMDPYWTAAGVSLDTNEFTKLRNLAIHQSLAIPRAVAEAAVALVAANYQEFVRNWANKICYRHSSSDLQHLDRRAFNQIWSKEVGDLPKVFEGHGDPMAWRQLTALITERMPWDKLCDLCGLDFLPLLAVEEGKA